MSLDSVSGWSPGSVCVFQMVEILEKAVKDTVKEGLPGGQGQGDLG